jgi:WD40 repeat protein
MKPGDRERSGAFVSYARADGEAFALSLVQRLAAEAPDIEVWIDRQRLEGGVGWWSQIEARIGRSEFLLLVMTPMALRSRVTRLEWRLARQRGVCVYPLIVDGQSIDFAGLPGWMNRAHFYDLHREWPKLLAHLRRGCAASRVPFMAPALPEGHVALDERREPLIRAILDDRKPAANVVVLRGPGGFGKTTLASEVCHDEGILDAFDDGVLWVTLGQRPNLQHEVQKLYAALTGERPGFIDLDEAARELAVQLEHKHCLIVVDDCWRAEHLEPFLRGGPSCTRLVTTRAFEVAMQGRSIETQELRPDEAARLLAARLPERAADGLDLAPLVERVGAWPLGLRLAGAALRERLAQGDTAVRAVAQVERALIRRGITAFDDPASGGRHGVASSIDAGLDLLEPNAQRLCIELSVFPEDVAVPLDAAARLWRLDDFDAEELARRLDGLALADFDLPTAQLHLHDMLRAYYAERLGSRTAEVHRRLLDDCGDDRYEQDRHARRFRAYHLACAGREAELRSLLLSPSWIGLRVRAGELHALLADCEQLPGDPALRLVASALRLSAGTLARDPAQLASQLTGRLIACGDPEVTALCDGLRHLAGGLQLVPLHPTLDPAGGPLQATLSGHLSRVNTLVVDPAWRHLVSAGTELCAWDLERAELVAAFGDRRLEIQTLFLDPAHQCVTSAGAEGVLRRWAVPTGEAAGVRDGWERRAVRAGAASADGQRALAVDRDGRVFVVETGAEVRELRGRLLGHVRAAAISADGAVAAFADDGGSAAVVDLATGSTIAVPGSGGVRSLALDPGGAGLLIGRANGSIAWWVVGEAEPTFERMSHTAPVDAVHVCGDGRIGFSGAADGTLCRWNLANGDCLNEIEAHGDTVTAIVADAAGERFATSGHDRLVRLWRPGGAPARAQAGRTRQVGGVTALAFSADDSLIASGGADGSVVVRRVDDGLLLHRFAAHAGPVRTVTFDGPGRTMLTSGVDGRHLVWLLDTGDAVPLPVRHLAPLNQSAIGVPAKYLATACADRCLYLWDAVAGVQLERLSTRQLLEGFAPPNQAWSIDALGVNRLGTHVVLGTRRSSGEAIWKDAPEPAGAGAALVVYEPATAGVRRIAAEGPEPFGSVAVDARGLHLAWTRQDLSVRYVDLSDERVVKLGGHVDRVSGVAVGTDGKTVWSCGKDRRLILWDTGTGSPLARFDADAPLRTLALGARNSLVAAGDDGGRVHVLRTGPA